VSGQTIRVLFLSDTHLGLDLPTRPRVMRRRRGPEFFAGFERALAPALAGDADLVVHGGDLFYRSQVPPVLVERAFAPLRRVADTGVPVVVVPGNHERSRIPHAERIRHPRIHVCDRPRTVALEVRGLRVALAGFPFVRHGVRDGFTAIVESTRWRDLSADVRLLCLHQCVEGARVGAWNYTFRNGDDVIRGADLPRGFAATLAGHVHRAQVLTRDLAGRRLATPVFYAGSVERTSFAERGETKGCLRLELEADGTHRGRVRRVAFRALPTRPMVQLELSSSQLDGPGLRAALGDLLARQHPDAVVRLKLVGGLPVGSDAVLRAAALRALAPATLNVSVRWTGDPMFRIDT